ncbi:hypothetical protein LOY96_003755 [Ophidiomyces ophidiicola]|nr:hypothetical protein LOY96_003755 [Ophidiomyces ophidiicola]
MRLHLVIHRHELPTIRILWTPPSRSPGLSHLPSASSSFTLGAPQPPTAGRTLSASTSFNTALTTLSTVGGYTIAQLLADVNDVVPLETRVDYHGEQSDCGHWGLEDYVVELMGSECLHFMETVNLLRDGDELVIRPLHYEELEARHITGRHQVATDGTHLIDGVAFGKKYLKRAASRRPPIRIPPRSKRRRLEEREWDYDIPVREPFEPIILPPKGRETEFVHGVILAEPIQSEDHQKDENTRLRKVDEALSTKASTPLNHKSPSFSENDIEILHVVKKSCTKSPNLEGSVYPISVLDRAEEYRTENESKYISLSSGSESSESGSELSSATTDAHEDGETESSDLKSSTSVSGTSQSSSSSSVSSSSSSDDGLGSESGESVPEKEKRPLKPDVPFTQPVTPRVNNAPGTGSRRTRHSNLRTKLRKRLAKMKAAGVLPQDANFDDLRNLDEFGALKTRPKMPVPATQTDETAPFTFAKQENEHHQYLESIEAIGLGINPDTKKNTAQTFAVAPSPMNSSASVVDVPLPENGVKLNLANTRRLLFGSLGLRTPKTKGDAERLKAQLTEKLKICKVAIKEQQSQEPIEKSHALMPVENWQDFLNVKAIECIYEDVSIPPPPFPFVQRWDSESQKLIRQRRNNGSFNKGKKRKRKSRNDEEHDHWQPYENEEYSNANIILNYSDTESNEKSKQETLQPVMESATEKLHIQQSDTAQQTNENAIEPGLGQTEEDLPVYEGLSSYETATENDLKVGAIIAFKQLEVSKTTNWQPVVSSYRTAIVEQVIDASNVQLRLAMRDREKKPENQETEPRVYSGFEMPGYEDEQGDDDGIRDMEVYQLIEPKLLRSAPAIDLEGAIMVNGTQENDIPDCIPESIHQNAEEPELPPISSQTRRDISQIIDDAGFRSAIDSDLNVLDEPIPVADSPNSGTGKDDNGPELQAEDVTPVIESPSFNGFERSPPHETNEPRSPDATPRPSNSAPIKKDVCHKPSPGTQTSSVKNSAQQEHAVPSMPSEDSLHYISDLDTTVPDSGAPNGSQLSKLKSSRNATTHSKLSQSQEEPDPERQVGSLLCTIHPSAVEAENDRPNSSGSMVPNPFYEVDRLLFEDSDSPPLDAIVSSTAPPRLGESVDGKPPVRIRKNRLSSSRRRQYTPQFSDDNNGDVEDDVKLPEPQKAVNQLENSQKIKTEIASSQAHFPDPQIIVQGSQFVDLTISSDPVSPGGSDGDFAKSQGLPNGSGWVQKQTSSYRRTRNSINRNTDKLSQPRRTRTRRSVI